MGQALYRKYRSRAFDEVVGQDHIVKTLQNAIKSGRVSHAYLFTGPRGVGKTSVARILAHEVNGLDYDDESIHLDIIEIDAASNRRIDEIRELRERVHVAPTSAKYKVYIIDEVHMLTREAFNALLKTLEEPPAHCIFILATTEAHKLPETIVSRTQRFTFQPIAPAAATVHLQEIAKREKIDITPEAIELLAEHGAGSFRDSISLLDQLAGAGGKIDGAKVREMLGLPPAAAIKELLDGLDSQDAAEALQSLGRMKEQGTNPTIIAKELSQQLRNRLLEGKLMPWGVKLLRRLSRVGGAADPQERLEIDILEAVYSAPTNQISQPRPPKSEPRDTPDTTEAEPDDEPEKVDEPESEPVEPKSLPKSGKFDLNMWPEVLDKAKSEAGSIYTALRLAEPRLEDNGLVLAFQFPLHQKKLAQVKNLDLIAKIIEQQSGAKLKVSCVVDKTIERQVPKAKAAKPEVTEKGESLQAISNIFGGAEMLES